MRVKQERVLIYTQSKSSMNTTHTDINEYMLKNWDLVKYMIKDVLLVFFFYVECTPILNILVIFSHYKSY